MFRYWNKFGGESLKGGKMNKLTLVGLMSVFVLASAFVIGGDLDPDPHEDDRIWVKSITNNSVSYFVELGGELNTVLIYPIDITRQPVSWDDHGQVIETEDLLEWAINEDVKNIITKKWDKAQDQPTASSDIDDIVDEPVGCGTATAENPCPSLEASP